MVVMEEADLILIGCGMKEKRRKWSSSRYGKTLI